MTTPDTAGGWEWSGGGIASISKSLNDFGKGGVQVLSQLIYAVHAEESWTKYLTPAEPEDLNQQVLQSWKDPPPSRVETARTTHRLPTSVLQPQGSIQAQMANAAPVATAPHRATQEICISEPQEFQIQLSRVGS